MSFSLSRLFMLLTALSLDAFAASFVYGTDNVKIPAASVSVITALSTGILFFFLFLGKWCGSFISPSVTSVICFLILFFLGLAKLFDSTLKSLIKRSGCSRKNLNFSFANLNFILTVYADPARANEEDISVLSPAEALPLGAALSLDSAVAGFGAGMAVLHLPMTLCLSVVLNIAAVLGGSFLGRVLVKKTDMDLSWLSGILLLALAFSKLF